ncbi:MAG: uncharacterized SAM-binding protein YcdF (DUF218 family) [Candidatus Marinamargulisbacteria bacterium]|jgi:uncharacterized SAM-binding protein YcdF (DUF218 family)
MKRIKWVWLPAIFAIVCLFAFRVPLMKAYAKVWHFSRLPEKPVDAVLMLGGSAHTRLAPSVQYFRSGKANSLVLSSPKPYNLDFPAFLVDETASVRKIMKSSYKLDRYSFLTLKGEQLTSTYEESMAFRDYCMAFDIKSAVVVTDAYHSRRSYIIFRNALPKTVELYILPIENRLFDEENWWTSDTGVAAYYLEFIKLINYYLNQKGSLDPS